MCVLALWQVLDGGDEFESLWEELGGSGEHQLVGLSDRHVGHTGDVGDLFLGTLVARRLVGRYENCEPKCKTTTFHMLIGYSVATGLCQGD